MSNKEYSYEGCQATADILLNEYPKNMVDLVRDCIKYSNLTVVSEHVKQFTPEAATVVFILSESHLIFHEYPESNYITVDCYTCGEEGNPLAALNHLVNTLNDLVGVKDKEVKFFKRGEFKRIKADVTQYELINVTQERKQLAQSKIDNICKSLTAEQVKDLQEVLDLTAYTDYS